MNRLRVITPIISRGFRDDDPLHDALPKGSVLSQVFLNDGPASVESAVDEVLAGPGILDAALRAEDEAFQAIVIDCMLDPALEAAREMVTIPVIGCGETGMAAAAAQGRFSVVTVLQRQERDFRALAARYGLGNRLASVRGIGVSVLALEQDRATSIAATIREARLAAAEDGAEAIVFGCTGMLGFAAPVAEALGWTADRVVDPLPAAIREAHAAVMAGRKTDKALYPAPIAKTISGFRAWPLLTATMEGTP
jgi:allantoin racemase